MTPQPLVQTADALSVHRRRLLLWPALTLLGCSPAPPHAVAAPPAGPLTEEEQRVVESRQRMREKFGGRGFRLRVDAMKGQELFGVSFYAPGEEVEFFGSGSVSLSNRANYDGPSEVPERVRVVWRDSDKWGIDKKSRNVYSGKIIGDEMIEVGSRIPQELLDDLKRDPKGGMNLKFRLSHQGTYFGWDIERRPGYDPKKRDQWGEAVYVAPVHSFAGGDFREARIYNGQAIRLGWYIDKKTGQKIETDF